MTPERSDGTLYLAMETEPGTSRPRKRSGATRGPAPPSPGVRMRNAGGGERAARRAALEDADTGEEPEFQVQRRPPGLLAGLASAEQPSRRGR